MQRIVDGALAVTKESVKTVTYESLNNIVRFINGVSALLLAVVPGKTTILEGIHGWELRPTFRGPRLPRFMQNGVSSFNQLIHELSVDSDTSSLEYSSGEDSDGISPPSPASQSSRVSRGSNSGSRVSRGSTSSKHESRWKQWIKFMFWWIFLPIKLLLWIPLRLLGLFYKKGSKVPLTPRRSHQPSSRQYYKNANSVKEQVVHHTIDKRRGVIEDLHLGIEILIESIFDFFHKAAHFILSPFEAIRMLWRWLLSSSGTKQNHNDEVDLTVQTATLGDNDAAVTERNASSYPSMNTDTRTCQDVITEHGYPYEAIRVITSDGYVLLLERIPRRDARKAVFFLHGVLDSSMGWVSYGVVGSPAFAAYDQGYDVYLGNLRGLVSREHVNKKLSSREYWNYSINDLGTKDAPAIIEKINEIKTSELKLSQPDFEEEINEEQPYKLCAVSHSLGGAVILTYIITNLIEEKPHRLSRVVLLSPAGFHGDSSFVFTMIEYFVILCAPFLPKIVPAFYIPTRFFRMLMNKLVRDFHNYPAIGGLVQTLMSYFLGGDSSNWVGVIGLPHYNMNDMPGVSYRVGLHLAQMKRSKKFRMFDYGSASANMEVYGTPEPFDLGENYEIIDVPVDLVAGRKDKIIMPSMVRQHYDLMKKAGVDASYSEFEYAHNDFMFSNREELLAYVMSRLLLVEPPLIRPRKSSSKRMRLNKKTID